MNRRELLTSAAAVILVGLKPTQLQEIVAHEDRLVLRQLTRPEPNVLDRENVRRLLAYIGPSYEQALSYELFTGRPI